MKIYKKLLIILISGIALNLNAKTIKKTAIMRNINIAGLIVDSQTLLPVEGAVIYDEKNNALATTNLNGYFQATLNIIDGGEIKFKLLVEKLGYQSFNQKERWADLKGNLNAIYYFGLRNSSSSSKAFSELVSNKRDLSYPAVKDSFSSVKEKIDFQKSIESAKIGNENLFFEIGKESYLISSTGWLKINNPDDIISINGKKKIPAKDINSQLKRNEVKKMSPTESKEAPFEVYTF